MDNEKVDEVLTKYAKDFEFGGYSAVRGATDELVRVRTSARDYVEHLHWMCKEAASWGPERIEKKMRWLGFIQGGLWALGIYTIDELKADNMPERPYCGAV